MSNAIYPIDLPGLDVTVGKAPEFSTIIQAAVDGSELRIAERAFPLWVFSFKYNFLRATSTYPELSQLLGFYLARLGPADSFLLQDPEDYQVTDQQVGIGNGTNRDFQAVRTLGGFAEPVFNPNTSSVKVNGVLVSSAHQGSGILRTATAPPAGAVVTWSGTFWYRCRFEGDKLDTQKFMHQLWNVGRVNLRGSLQNKIA